MGEFAGVFGELMVDRKLWALPRSVCVVKMRTSTDFVV